MYYFNKHLYKRQNTGAERADIGITERNVSL